MGKNCEDIRQLLVELEYDELDAMDANAVRTHLADCDECSSRQQAYRAVRADLKAWDEVEPAPSRITFVAMQRQMATTPQWSPWRKGAAVAASFLLGFLLIAAVANFRISSTDGAWSVSTSLWPGAAGTTASEPASTSPLPVTPVGTRGVPRGLSPQGAASGQPGMVQVAMNEAQLDAWLEDRLRARGLHVAQGDTVAPINRAQVMPLLQQLMVERDAQVRSLVQDLVAASDNKQREDFDDALAGVYQTFDAQRMNDLLFLAGEMGMMQESTGLELQRTNAAIDYLITRAATDPRQEQQREDDE